MYSERGRLELREWNWTSEEGGLREVTCWATEVGVYRKSADRIAGIFMWRDNCLKF